MSPGLRLWFLLFTILIISAVQPMPARAVASAQRTDAFRSARCMFDLPAGAVESRDVECGYLAVPERYGQPEGPTIELAVAIIKSHAANPAPDPLVMLQGGPGGSTIDTYASLLLSQRPLQIDRDIVLFDQRGTLYSQPNLQCHETFDLLIRTIDKRLSDEEEQQQSLAAITACHDRLVRQGIDLADYDSVENADDVESLRVALGYSTINLYGVSYGTLLALHVMQQHPDALRSVILDAVVPPQINFIEHVPQSQERAFDELFRACAADVACNAAYPKLDQVFFQLVDAWNKKPVRIPLTDPQTNTTYQAVFDGDMLIDATFQMVYATSLIPALPKMIYDARDGTYTFLSYVYPILLFDRTFSEGMYYSVLCAEDADFNPADVPLEGVRPELAKDARQSAQSFLDTCQRWHVPPLEPIVDAPVTSNIPTLVLNGRFDPITPPAFGQAAAQTLSHSYVFTFANTGHGALIDSPCATSLARAFLADPQRAPDASCVAQLSAPTFIAPANTLMSPGMQRLLATLNGNNPMLLLPLFVLLLGLLVLLSFILIWPLGWLIRLLRREPADRRPAAWIARIVAALAGLLSMIFVIGATVALFRTESDNNIVLFFGLPREYAPLFALPLAVVLLVPAMIVFVVLAWRRAFWSIWGRIYYTLLTLGALSVAGVLVWWRLPGVLFGM
jgi:pimeloyl-ACP methyl ester carboxylesterase